MHVLLTHSNTHPSPQALAATACQLLRCMVTHGYRRVLNVDIQVNKPCTCSHNITAPLLQTTLLLGRTQVKYHSSKSERSIAYVKWDNPYHHWALLHAASAQFFKTKYHPDLLLNSIINLNIQIFKAKCPGGQTVPPCIPHHRLPSKTNTAHIHTASRLKLSTDTYSCIHSLGGMHLASESAVQTLYGAPLIVSSSDAPHLHHLAVPLRVVIRHRCRLGCRSGLSWLRADGLRRSS